MHEDMSMHIDMDMEMHKRHITRRHGRIPGRRWTIPALALAILLVGAGLLGGCGGGGNDGGGGSVIVPPPPPNPPPSPGPVEMVLDEIYEVDSGARLVNRSATPAHIEVRHAVTGGSRFAILREGAADLHR
jgi:hypothetical protein